MTIKKIFIVAMIAIESYGQLKYNIAKNKTVLLNPYYKFGG